MVIGIKYCGGCNSIYNRGRQVNRLKEQFPEHAYCTAAERLVCDIWLVVCGCLRACAAVEGLTATKRMFVLPTERSFEEIRAYLLKEREKEEPSVTGVERSEKTETGGLPAGNGQRRLRVGQEAELKKTFFKDDVDKFAALTGDYNRLHTDVEFAAGSPYGRPVVHGMLAASLISSAMGMKLPGEGTVLIEENVRLTGPVFYGDTVTAAVRLIACRESEEQYIGTLSGICRNQKNEVVAVAKCRQLLSKKLFLIENPEDRAEEMEI